MFRAIGGVLVVTSIRSSANVRFGSEADIRRPSSARCSHSPGKAAQYPQPSNDTKDCHFHPTSLHLDRSGLCALDESAPFDQVRRKPDDPQEHCHYTPRSRRHIEQATRLFDLTDLVSSRIDVYPNSR